MPPPGRFSTADVVVVVLGAALFLGLMKPGANVGFLADDYYAGARVAAHAVEHPGLVDRIVSTFTYRWVSEFEFYRPVTMLTIQADYGLFGVDGRAHHLTNRILWICVAAATALLFSALIGSRRGCSVPFLLTLFGAAAVEALAWLVARSDLLMASFGLLALWARVTWPGSRLAPLPFLALALLSKETAVVLVPLLAWTAWWPGANAGIASTRIATREALPWMLLGFYFVLRARIFGHIALPFGDATPFSGAGIVGALHNAKASLLQLVAPENQSETLRGCVVASPRLPVLLLAGLLLVCGFAGRRPGDGRRMVALAGLVLAPIALLAPVYGVGPDLEQSRILVLPHAGWALGLALATHRAMSLRFGRYWAGIALLALLFLSYVMLDAELRPYVAATDAAEHALATLEAAAAPGEAVVLLGVETSPGVMRDDLVLHHGAYVLSGGLHHAVRPPFTAAPGIELRFESAPGDPPYGLVLLAPRTLAWGQRDQPPPAFELIAPATSIGEWPTPGDGAPLELSWPPARWASIDRLRVLVRSLDGVQQLRHEISAARMAELMREGGVLRLEALFATPPGEPPAPRVWWCEGFKGDVLVFRSPWTLDARAR